MTHFTDRIEQLLAPAMDSMGLGVVRVLLGGNKRKRLQVMIERKDGTPLGMDDCVAANHQISLLLDVDDPIEGSYDLEVTSPGLDRPLVRRADYERFVGERVRVHLLLPVEGRRNISGILEKSDESGCQILVHEKGKEECRVRVEYTNITQAQLDPIVDFNALIRNKAGK